MRAIREILVENMPRVLPLLLAIAACNGDPVRPQSLGQSRYVEIFAWEETELCRGTLEYFDTYLEAIFIAIDEPFPEESFIEYTWFDLTVSDEEKQTWPCPPGASGCARKSEAGISISSYFFVHHHELVHAVHLYALGSSHPLLHEGLASYYGNPNYRLTLTAEEVDEGLRDFFSGPLTPGEFSYPVAKYFVGYVVETFGVDGLKDLWAGVTKGQSYGDFRSAYEDILGAPFDDLLNTLPAYDLTHQTLGQCSGTEIPWVDPDLLEVSISGQCDDPGAIGPISLAPLAFSLPYLVEVPVTGDYQLLLTGGDNPGGLTMYGCGMKGENQYMFLSEDQPENRLLIAGTYAIIVDLPAVEPEATLQFSVRRLPPAP